MASLLDGIIPGAGVVAGGIVGGVTSALASRAQQKAAGKARDALTSSYNQAKGYQQPTYDTGMRNLSTLDQMVNSGAYKVDPYNYQIGQAPNDQFKFQTDPGYQFRMQQGANSLNSGAAAAGGQLSGATQKALQRYGQNFASNEYGNAYDRYNKNRAFNQGQYEFGTTAGMSNAMNQYTARNQQAQNQYTAQSGLANMGVNAGNYLSNLASNYGQNMAGQWGNMGNAQAAGYMGVGQAAQTGINNLAGGFGGLQGGWQTLAGLLGYPKAGSSAPAVTRQPSSVYDSGASNQVSGLA
jgi:hypothetical protein